MNFLILSVTAGEGHNSAAGAIRNALEDRGADCTVLDTFDYLSPELARFLSEGYLLVTEKAKNAYRIGYRFAEKHSATPLSERSVKLFNLPLADELAEYIRSDSYDAVIFTHPFAGVLLDVMKERQIIADRTVGILTDFTFHPYWEDCTLSDYVVTPDRLLLPQARRKGFRGEQILPFGIPVHPKFASRLPKAEARRLLGLNADLPVFLFMGGSMGHGRLTENIRRLDAADFERDFQIVAVCGRNDELRAEAEAIAAGSRHRITVTGFVDTISVMMDAADCLITKPGGLTSSEALAKGLPMILADPIPGQEERNAEFLLNAGCAAAISPTCPIDDCVYGLLASEARLSAMRSCIAAVGKPNSTADTADFLVDLAHTPVISNYRPPLAHSDFADHPLCLDEEGRVVR